MMAAPWPAFSQQDQGFLARTLEAALSGQGRVVQVFGVEGALSSTASVARMTVADGQGVWADLRDLTLDWNRAALLRGRLEVKTLSIGHIDWQRLPKAPPTSAEAGDFAWPQLPVALQIDRFDIRRADLGPDILGAPASLTITALAAADAQGLRLEAGAERLDETLGSLDIVLNFSALDQSLNIHAAVSEPSGGLLARALDLPGAPAVDLTLSGQGILPQFQAKLALATDGQDRLTGGFDMQPSAQGRQVKANLQGDLRPLLPADYAPLLGAAAQLRFSAALPAEGGPQIDDLWLRTRALDLRGKLRLNREFWPDFASLSARLGDPSGAALVLPWGDSSLGRGQLSLDFDLAQAERIKGRVEAFDLRSSAGQARRVSLALDGSLQGYIGSVGQLLAQISMETEGLAPVDPALAQALDGTLRGAGQINYIEGQPLRLHDLHLGGTDFDLGGDVIIGPLTQGIPLRFDLTLAAQSLQRFSAIAGRSLHGQAELGLRGWAQLLAGRFDVDISGKTQDLSVDHPNLDPLLQGASQIKLSAVRDETGTALRRATLQNRAVDAQASGVWRSANSQIETRARLLDISLLVPELSGALDFQGRAQQAAQGWQIAARLEGPAGARADLDGLAGAQMDLRVQGQLPLALAQPFLRPRQVQGQARFDLAVQGPPKLASLSGEIIAQDARFSAPNLRLSLTGIDARLRLAQAAARLDLRADVAAGGQIGAQGTIGLTGPGDLDVALDLQGVTVMDPQLYRAVIGGGLHLQGSIARPRLVGGLTLLETLVFVPSARAAALVDIPDIRHIAPGAAVLETLDRAGAGPQDNSPGPVVGLDVDIRAPSKIFVRGRGIDAEMGGAIGLSGTTQNMVSAGQFDLIRGRIDLLGKRFDLIEGAARFQGGAVPNVRFVTQTSTQSGSAQIVLEGPANAPIVSFVSTPSLPEDEVLAQLLFGRSLTRISAFQALQLASAVAELSGRGGAGLVARLRDSFGLDDFDVTTSQEGTTQFRAGKYVSENVYSDVTADSEGKADISLNLDLTPSVTVKGRVGTGGDTGLGVFFEKDY